MFFSLAIFSKKKGFVLNSLVFGSMIPTGHLSYRSFRNRDSMSRKRRIPSVVIVYLPCASVMRLEAIFWAMALDMVVYDIARWMRFNAFQISIRVVYPSAIITSTMMWFLGMRVWVFFSYLCKARGKRIYRRRFRYSI